MRKNKWLKAIKTISIILAITTLISVVLGVYSFTIITKDASLNKNLLTITPTNLKVLTNSGESLQTSNSTIKLSELNEYTKNAFIAKEDKRFYSHKGFDVVRILGALKNNMFSGEIVEGGSTISQQLIKNTHTGGKKTMKRKLNELKLATKLEEEYTKDEILEMYLNTIYFGNNCYGINSASNYYFNKSASKLSLAESAMLSGIISAPSVYNPVADLEISKKRAKIVLSLMQEQGYINETQKEVAEKELETIECSTLTNSCSLYMNFALQEACEILNIDSFDTTENIEIITYLNKDLQQKINQEVNNEAYTKANNNGISPDICCITLDNKTGGIIAFDGKSKFNLLSLRRQPASTIKPILVYAPAFENKNLSPASLILDEPINYSGYTPQNATKLYYGYTSVRDSLIRSLNIPAVKQLYENGIENSKQFAKNCGINFSEEDNNLALALGGFTNGVTACELAGAYSCFARGGTYIKPHFVKEIIINGVSCYKDNPAETRVMKESTAYLITDILKDVAQVGTGRKIKSLGTYMASKTGTNASENNNLDAINVSYTTNHTCLCWIGNTSNEDGSMIKSINGSTYPTIIVKNVFALLYDNNKPEDFVMPQSVKEVKISKDEYEQNHKIYLADETDTGTILELFQADNLPPKKDSPIIMYNGTKIFNYYMLNNNNLLNN